MFKVGGVKNITTDSVLVYAETHSFSVNINPL